MAKPRTTRPKKKPSNQQNDPNNGGVLDSAFNAVADLSLSQKLGLGVSALALLSTAVVMRAKKQPRKSKKDKTNSKLNGLEEITPLGGTLSGRGRGTLNGRGRGTLGGRGGRSPGNRGRIPVLSSKKEGTKKGDKLKKIKTEHVTKLFQTCLSSKRPQQQLIADQFYEEISKWSSDQLEISGQTIIVNFLFWYYRSTNVPETKFYSDQAEHIRYWADYKCTKDTKWDYYNIKFDYLYSTALLQRSIPHMKRFYHWICNESARSMPDDASSRKPNYYLTRYQTACILGDWSDSGVCMLGQRIKEISSTATSSTATRSDYFMHYTLRSLELPASNPNFGLIFKTISKLKFEFPSSQLPPPVFDSWNILSFRYRNTDYSTPYPIDQEFIFATGKIKDSDGYYKFYPGNANLTARLNKKVNIWGRVCQLVSPVFGASGFLPITGSLSDIKIYGQSNWTYRGSGNRLVRKHVIMKIERLPFEKEIESKDYFGQTKKQTGYLWTGYITIHMKRLKQGVTLRNIYDDEGEEHFDGEEAIKLKEEKKKKKDEKKQLQHIGNGVNNDENNENNAESKSESNDVGKDGKDDEEDDVQTQIYEVELIISKDDPNQTDNDIKKRILTAMNMNNSKSPSSTPK